LLDYLARIVIDATSSLQDHQRRWIHDEYNVQDTGQGYSDRAGWLEQQPDGTWRAFGAYTEADGTSERFFVSGTTEQEAMAEWQRAYGALADPWNNARPEDVTYSGGAYWYDEDSGRTVTINQDSWDAWHDDPSRSWNRGW
jgi:hypothetical protein